MWAYGDYVTSGGVRRYLLVLLAFVGLAVRAAHLAVFDRRGAARGEAQSLRTITLAPESSI